MHGSMGMKCTTCSVILVVSGIIVVSFAIGLLAGGYDALYNAVLHSKYQVLPGKEVEDIWENIPVPMTMRVFFFNITNSDKFLEGETPELEEIGPFVYREYHHKENLTYNENMTVTFYQKRWWIYDEELSGNFSLDTIIHTINAVPVSAAFTVEDSSILMLGLNRFLNKINEPAIAIATASEMLFDGFEDPLLTFLQNITDLLNTPDGGDLASPVNFLPSEMLEYDKFGWFYKRNNSVTYDGIFNMFTGESSIDDVGMIGCWDYSNVTNYFDAPCNTINGTAGEFWPPGVNRDFIQFYNPDLCMSVKLYYQEDIEDSYGIQGYRFWGSNRTFANKTYAPENKCFCIDGSCAPNGLLDAQTCRFGSPAFVSFPHFYNADPALVESVIGLDPDPDQHSFYMDINPDLGIPLRVAARMQINLRVKPYPGKIGGFGSIEILKSVPDVILPIIWFEVLSEMTPNIAGEIKTALFFKNSVLLPIIFSLMALFGTAIVSYIIIRSMCKRTRNRTKYFST